MSAPDLAGPAGWRGVLTDLRPGSTERIDAGFVLVTSLLALLTLRGTFDGWAFLPVATVGVVIGLVIAHAATVLRVPWLGVPLLLALGYLLFGGAVALGADPRASWIPGPATVRELFRVATHGWTQLLTTLPPAPGTGALLALPFLLGLAAGGLGLTVAARTTAAGSPLLVVLVTLATAVLLGTADPGTLTLVGVGLGLAALSWTSLRSQRSRVSTATGRLSRAITAAVVLAVAGAAVVIAGPILPGTGTAGRTVLRAHITPPLDLSAFPSPLVGFRKYAPPIKQLADRALFRVRGLPAGTRMRIATLDAYDGQVWGVTNDAAAPAVGRALNTFQRVGAKIAPTTNGRRVDAQVTIAADYAAAPDTSGWLPDAGSLTSVRFDGGRADKHQSALRYNLATGTAVVPDRLRSGDSYSFTATVPSGKLPTRGAAGGTPQLDPGAYNFVAPSVAKWTAGTSGDAWQQLLAVALHLHTDGAFSDGGPGESQFLPGHGIGRLSAFLDGAQLVGDDEQYAAVFALMANDLGIPARVVVGAVPERDGTVRGRDVHAWVEVLLRGRGWSTVPTSVFTPVQTHKPTPQKVQTRENSDASVVPPPNSVRPPSSLDQLAQAESNSSRRAQHTASKQSSLQVPGFVRVILSWGAPPVLLALLFMLVVVTLKAIRRRRRRTAGSAPGQVAAGWREVLDQARDLGSEVTRGLTRREQAEELPAFGLDLLAQRADRALFSPHRPAASEAGDFWADVVQVRRDMLLGVGRWPRLRARLSLRSFRSMPRTRQPFPRGVLPTTAEPSAST